MTSYLRRLLRALVAYQVADVVSKFIALILLPIYTRYIAPAGYGMVELLGNGVILISILVRFGMIEAFLRFYFTDADRFRRDALARRAVAFMLAATSVTAVILMIAARPLADLVLGAHHAGIFRVAVLGLWSFTNLELAYGMLRVEERVRAYTVFSLINVALTISASLVLVVGLGQGARGLLLGNYGASTLVLLGLWWGMRRRLLSGRRAAEGARGERMATLLRFGLPTVPAEASVYALSIIDRYYIYHHANPVRAGLYSIAVKLAGAVTFIVRAFQYAWPPLAYSVTDDAEASRLYALVTTYYVLVSGWVVVALLLLGRWVVRLLAAPAYFDAHRALPWVALGWAMYGLWVIFLVLAGRAGATGRNFPSALTGLATNVVLLVLLVPRLGIAGAGLALSGAYAVMLAVMHLLTRRAFAVRFEWVRLARLGVVLAGVGAAGELLLPPHGAAGLLTRAGATAAIPVILWLTGFLQPVERERIRVLIERMARRGATGEPA